MSKAGIQSNRGDGYQTLVAFDWALTVLSDPDYQWLEVDSVDYLVDDVVIGKADGTKICCQCKKNQTRHKAWSLTDLKDELLKAISLLTRDSTTTVRFYSRSNFGELERLREYSTSYADDPTYKANLGQSHKKTDAALENLLAEQSSSPSTYQFLQHTRFEISPELDRMQTLLRERLRQLVSNHSVAYDTLWTHLDHLGMRENSQSQNAAIQHRLTKDDLKNLLVKAGSIPAPSMDKMEIINTFKNTSAIGRSWNRKIGNECIPNPVVATLIEAIDAKHHSILLTGLPGSGKTCVMLDLQEILEQRSKICTDLLPLFIQSREFVDVTTAQDRQAQGLSEQWVEQVARMAEQAQVVVIIDSLDVLSIAREHNVLIYFLAQIDRLLQIPNVTVVTACRDFDRRYDRHIAQRNWDKEITCQPLDWETEIVPLLGKLNIDASSTNEATRELIRNPRELALYVELAQQEGSFNVVTSQTLAQRYLNTVMNNDSALGNEAMQAIENMATEMLKLRSLTIAHQRFTASQEIQRTLLSNNILHQSNGQLAFGHQTLLDVLVISGAIRQALTLNQFIQQLPPVPFVRPSIRSFVLQLATGDRSEFRKQLRTVLTGNDAFHIRRLVAETFAEQAPHDDDWPLLRDLRNQNNEVFQVIYIQAGDVEWHHFWMKNLVPTLKNAGNTDELMKHVYRVSQWKNNDPKGISAFWMGMLSQERFDKAQLNRAIAHDIAQLHEESWLSYIPLLTELLKLPRQEDSPLGQALARGTKNGDISNAVFWDYIVSEVTEEDVIAYEFNNKLHCQPHEFDENNDHFLVDQMKKSTALLDLAIISTEQWSQIKASQPVYGSSFLNETSHNQNDHQHQDSIHILMDAIEAAIVYHSNDQSPWWKTNRERLCFSSEDALRYFAILACTAAPTANLDIISLMLCDKALLESSLKYELGTLIQTAYVLLNSAAQDEIQKSILTIHQELTHALKLQLRAQLILSIPCHQRSPDAFAVLDEYEKTTWPLVRHPKIISFSGMVRPPFSHETFLDLSNKGVMNLLNHYNGYKRNSFDDPLVGGKMEVSRELVAAASNQPSRFTHLLSNNWEQISDCFRDGLMEGVANYLAYRYGNLQPSNSWSLNEKFNSSELAQRILDELEKHPNHWHHNHSASGALEGCAHVVTQPQDAARLVSLAVDFSTLPEKNSMSGDSVGLIGIGINMNLGKATEALVILANHLDENSVPWPESLPSSLLLFAQDQNPAIRALLLRRLPHLQNHHPELGWELFRHAIKIEAPGLWSTAEHCLYYAYNQTFETVSPWLTHLYCNGHGKDFEVWGRISALAVLSKHVEFSNFLTELKALDRLEAWQGAASVWTHPNNMQQHQDQCLNALEVVLNVENPHAIVIARKFPNLFREITPLISMPIELIQRYFRVLGAEPDSKQSGLLNFGIWLNATSLHDPMHALEATEIYLKFAYRTKSHVHNHEDNLTQLLTRLFAQSEEQEEADNGAMLQRVVAVQDKFLALGISGMNDWIKAAERP